MEDSSHRPPSFFTQADALVRKNITIQKRDLPTTIRLVLFPALLCLLLYGIQGLVNQSLGTTEESCDCGSRNCPPPLMAALSEELSTCPISSPIQWPVLFQIPMPEFRATTSNMGSNLFPDLPNESCKKKGSGSCPVTVLLTGGNRSLVEKLGRNLFSYGLRSDSLEGSKPLDASKISSEHLLGTDSFPPSTYFFESAFITDLYAVEPDCMQNSTSTLLLEMEGFPFPIGLQCVPGLHLWRDSSSEISEELYRGYQQGNPMNKINEIAAAYDFLSTNKSNFNATVFYNGTNRGAGLTRILRSVNMASNSFLKLLKGAGVKMIAEFVKEMPKGLTAKSRLDLSSLLGPLFFTWVIQLLFPVMLITLVYEKQQKLRKIMMMHGLGHGAYWTITYAYFLIISSVYMTCFVLFGSMLGLNSFRLNDYTVQLVFYFVYMNLQIAFAFIASTFFSEVKTASAIGYLYVFASGLMGAFLFQHFLQDIKFPRYWVTVMEILPGFSLYGGLYEFGQYSFSAQLMGTHGMTWKDVKSNDTGMRTVLTVMSVECLVMLPVAYWLDQAAILSYRIRMHRQKLCQYFFTTRCSSSSKANNYQERKGYDVLVNMERPDVLHEREVVEKLLLENSRNYAIICDSLKKIYPGEDGNPDKYAVRGLSLAVPYGECLGILGPNGAGKTSFINMMTGVTVPSSGAAFVQGLDIETRMNEVYSSIGVCPQHDLIWQTLTGREHLLFYGRLKNLKGHSLMHAVEEALRSVYLFDKGTADKPAGTYSGGMKRRLSVAISLIGNPRVVYMDEPSSGLDPASRKNLWKVVKQAKKGKAIILTTHSMEEAEILCDRIGIFVDGHLQCLGNPKELIARYGGHYVLTITTPSDHEEEVEALVRRLSPNMIKTYHTSRTQKFELPKDEVRLADIFHSVKIAKRKFEIDAWGLTDIKLEEVFINIAKGMWPPNTFK
ncbi:ABC transporter A family member 8-like [Aristolochia californica]|uniref:ABC transporter A family member 8-like n=1 Tax=Aristolochia californica TaxID=171875 RepID=UPI0035E12D3A